MINSEVRVPITLKPGPLLGSGLRLARRVLFGGLRLIRTSPSPDAYVVLLYHDIAIEPEPRLICVSVNRFRQHVSRLVRHVQRSGDSSTDGKKAPEKVPPHVLLTFDDAYMGTLEYAADVIEEAELPAQIFVVGRWSNRGYAGYTEGTAGISTNHRRSCLCPSDIRALRQRGFQFGSHGWSHSRLTQLGKKSLRQELLASRRWLEDVLGEAVDTFAYPYGDFDPAVVEAVGEAGFKIAYTTVSGFYDYETHPLMIPRIYVHQSFGPAEIDSMLQRWYPYVSALCERIKAHVRVDL